VKKVVSYVQGELLSIISLYDRISQWPERWQFTHENNFNLAVAESRLCLLTNEKLIRKFEARKSHASRTPDFFFLSLCSEMKRSRERDGRVMLETQP
jgi:hypothetical protein